MAGSFGTEIVTALTELKTALEQKIAQYPEYRAMMKIQESIAAVEEIFSESASGGEHLSPSLLNGKSPGQPGSPEPANGLGRVRHIPFDRIAESIREQR